MDSVLLPALDFMRTDKNSEPDTAYIRTRLTALLENIPMLPSTSHRVHLPQMLTVKWTICNAAGSDYTASLIGAAIGADEIEIWTDIDGMHNNDPRYVENTSPVCELHFEEAAELCIFWRQKSCIPPVCCPLN